MGEPQREPVEQDMRSAWFTRAEVEQMVRDGQMVDAKSIAALMLLNLRVQTWPAQPWEVRPLMPLLVRGTCRSEGVGHGIKQPHRLPPCGTCGGQGEEAIDNKGRVAWSVTTKETLIASLGPVTTPSGGIL